ncbi:MAG: CvpA family protein [Planctomycetes bacterium]|nr:CvpA family protein [Planctomycetota bacterium]
MNTIDLIVIGAVVLFGLLGLITGFLSQLFSIAALAAAWFLSRPVGAVVADYIAARSDTAPSWAFVLGRIIAGVAIFTAAKMLFHIVNHFVGKAPGAIKATNRLLGGVFGGAKAFIIAWIFLCLVAAFPEFFQKKEPNVHAMLQGSLMNKAVEAYNPAKESRLLGAAGSMVKILKQDPRSLERLKDDPDVAEFISVIESKASERIKDEEELEKIRSGDLSALLGMRELFFDPEVREALLKIDFSEALVKVARESEKKDEEPEPE